MKTSAKWIVSVVAGLAMFGMAYVGDQDRGKRWEATDPTRITTPAASAGFAFVYGIAGLLIVAAVLFVLPMLWRGFLKGTRDVSKAVRDKD